MPFIWLFLLFVAITLLSSARGQGGCRCSHENYDRDLQGGTFKSPMFPQSYCNNLDCSYEIEPKESWAVVLVVEYFDMETSHDYVEIYQSIQDIRGQRQFIKQHVLTGHTIAKRHFYSAIGGGLLVHFVTDASESSFAGFQISFSRFESSSRRNSPCPAPLHFAQATARMLPELSSIRTDSSCAFLINSTDAVQVTVKALAPSISLKIYETENFNMRSTGGVLQSMNGFALSNLPLVVTSRTSSLTIVISFSPNMHNNALTQSYNVEFKSAPSVCNCPPALIQLDYGVRRAYTSPGFPLEYCDMENCNTRVVIKRPSQAQNISITPVIRAHFESFRLETDVDYLEIIDQNKLIALTDSAKSIEYFTFDHADVAFRFVSDNTVTDIGFNLTLEIYQKLYYCQCPGSPQVLQENKYAQNYTFEEECRFMDCFWEIRPPSSLKKDEESKFRIVMKLRFQIDGSTEFIEISNGANLERNHERLRLDTMAALEFDDAAERHIEFDDPEFISVWYHRAGEVGGEARSLYIEYEWRKRCICGEEMLSADADEWKYLTSPDYPTPYCHDLNCTYRIYAGDTHNILINVTDFFTEVNQDFLMIFDGNSTSTQHLEALSGKELFTSPIRSKSNEMTLLFTSDSSLSMRGFALWYKAEEVGKETAADETTMASRGTHFSFAYLIIIMLLVVIIALLIYVARLQFPAKFNIEAAVRYIKM